MTVIIFGLVVILAATRSAHASPGDRSDFQRGCIRRCEMSQCSDLESFAAQQPRMEALLLWTCPEECKYQCMWKTVDYFTENGYPVPQFHGKWPFLRVYGIQEPASALFSVFNLIPHLYLIRRLRRSVAKGTRMLNVWTLYGLISINTWIWSTIFHTRDFRFTECMDYFCAFSVVVFSLLSFLLRLFSSPEPDHSPDGRFSLMFSFASTCLCLLLFTYHIFNMAYIKFDYGLNMIVNIAVGALNSLCWFAWCYKNRKTHSYVSYCAYAVLFINVSIVLEVFDFPPWLWLVDSHALWHLSTAPVHFLWYEFAIRDCQRLAVEDSKKKTEKKIV